MKAIISLLAFVLVASFGATWWYYATRSEQGLHIRFPEWNWSTKLIAWYYFGDGELHDTAVARIYTENGDQVGAVVTYSVFVHRSQLQPWGTLWRREAFAIWENGRWHRAGVTNFPKRPSVGALATRGGAR